DDDGWGQNLGNTCGRGRWGEGKGGERKGREEADTTTSAVLLGSLKGSLAKDGTAGGALAKNECPREELSGSGGS
uniref:Uncharacterized protein n=1 Tax=Globodera pallida TaxID=36090 RepID=A0A183CRE2_GLOPA